MSHEGNARHRSAPSGAEHRGHPAVWATLTLAVFPLVALSLGWLGYGPFHSFIGGAAATVIVLLIEAGVRGRWWMSDPGIAKHLGNPAFGHRLLVVTGVLMLLFQSFVLVGLLTSGGYDGNVVRYILARQCASGSKDTLFTRLCLAAPSERRMDAATMAIRETAERRMFPSGIVTCAVRPLASQFTAKTCAQAVHVRCDRWLVSQVARDPVIAETIERTVTAALTLMSDGQYRIDGWHEDPSSSGWQLVADAAGYRDTAPKDDPSMSAETYRRAVERLQSR